MYPTLVTIGPFSLSTYGVLAAAGYGAAIWWLSRRRGELGLSEDDFWSLIYWLFGGALVGGKLGYALAERDLSVLWRDPRYGFVFYGGFGGALLAGLIARRRIGFSYARLADYFGAALPLGHAIGRVGCFFAGCCYPTQLPEAGANLAIFGIVSRWGLRPGRKPGSAFLLYAVLYACVRFTLEFWRLDPRGTGLAGLSPSQVFALAALGTALWLWRRL